MNNHALCRGLRAHLPTVVLVLCLMQPLLDVLSYWLDVWAVGNLPTLLLRLSVLVFILALGFSLSQKKKAYCILFAVLALHMLGHSLICLHYGYEQPLHDLSNLVRIYQLPAVTFAFITFCKEDKQVLSAMGKGFLAALCVIFAVEILATLTGTDPHTYANKGLGLLGWFSTPSAQSAILSMLVPVAVVFVTEKAKFHPLAALGMGLLGFGMLYLFATRLSFAALVGTALALSIGCLILKGTQKLPLGKLSLLFLAFAVAAVLLIGVSPMTENNARVAENAVKKQEDITALVAGDEARALQAGLSEEDVRLARLKSAYEKYLPGVTERFGLERTAEAYAYSTDASSIADARQQKITYCRMLMEDQPLSCLFGLELGDLHCGDGIYDAENDFHGIFFLCGGIGLLLALVFLGYFLWRILRALIRKFKTHFTFTAAGYGIALICGLAHAYFTAGILRRPNANFYLALILAAVYALSMPQEETL